MSKKYLYYFSEGNDAFGGDKVTMKNTLGGKGAGLAEMTDVYKRQAVAHVDAGLDEGGAHQNVDLTVQQMLPHGVQLFQMCIRDRCCTAGR